MRFGPVLLNTSFNDADEPIVCSPTNAIRSFLRINLDALVVGSFLVERNPSGGEDEVGGRVLG